MRAGPLPTGRRAGLATLASLAAATVLAGCGFALRQAPELRFKTIQLTGFAPHSPLADELRSNLDASTTTRVVDGIAQAQVVLEVLQDSRDRVVVGSGAAGQVTEFQLRERFNFRVRAADGRILIPTTELLLSRDMSYTESAALGKEQEEGFLYRAMQSDIVSQVVRRLAAVPAP